MIKIKLTKKQLFHKNKKINKKWIKIKAKNKIFKIKIFLMMIINMQIYNKNKKKFKILMNRYKDLQLINR